MRRVVGILGGLGPDTTAKFYLQLIAAAQGKERPPVVIWSLSLDLQKEQGYIAHGRHTAYYRTSLIDGAKRLEAAGAQTIVIPCNTVHEFHDDIARAVRVPVLNLITVVAEEAVRRRWTRVLLLATSRTLGTGLYQSASERVEFCVPSCDDQRRLDRVIHQLLNGQRPANGARLLGTLRDAAGTDKVVLGCTDLQLIFTPSETVLDSMQTLALYTAGLLRRRSPHRAR